ncbi:hypothetical protein [Pantoea sp. At-9b]|uniref:hypothetical protein n=1 Tax=Pantoea sp. (strain At-9b) TaxID=592316 RepID=UPI0001B3EBEF
MKRLTLLLLTALTPAKQHHALLVVDEKALLSFGLDTPDTIVKLRHAAEVEKHD